MGSSTPLPSRWRAGPRSSSVRRFTITPESIRDGRVVFDRDESRHLARVLRLRPGDTVLAADRSRGEDTVTLEEGRARPADAPGGQYPVRLEPVGDEATGTVVGVGTSEHESPVRITLLQSVPKGDKMESIVRATTELGVARIVPVLTARTIVTLDAARWRDRARRWQRVAKEAAKQCGRALVPPVDVPRPLGEALELRGDADLRLCLWEEARRGAARRRVRGGGHAGGGATSTHTSAATSR